MMIANIRSFIADPSSNRPPQPVDPLFELFPKAYYWVSPGQPRIEFGPDDQPCRCSDWTWFWIDTIR